MAGYGQDRRLEALETEKPERPPIVVLSADFGGAEEAFAGYYARTSEDDWAEVVVVVLDFGHCSKSHIDRG